MLNKVMLIGRLGKEPEMRYTPQGSPITTFSLATERSWRDSEGQAHKETEWHRIVVWNKLAEMCHQYLGKGRLVYVEGRLQTRNWEDDHKVTHHRTEIIAEDVIFLERQPATATTDE